MREGDYDPLQEQTQETGAGSLFRRAYAGEVSAPCLFADDLGPSRAALACAASSPITVLDQTKRYAFQLHRRLASQEYCCKSSIVGQNLDRTECVIIPVPCKSWDCPHCGPRKRSAWIRRLTAGKPTRQMTLTCPVGKFLSAALAAQAMKVAWSKTVAKIRKLYGSFEYALVWELTKKGVPHMHILFRGSYVSQKWLSGYWDKLGIGPIVYIQSLKSVALHATHACKYLAKATGQSAAALAPLRVVQISNNYDLSATGPDLDKKYSGFVWSWDKQSPEDVVRRFQNHPLTESIQLLQDGRYEIKMKPHPLDLDFGVPPEFWVGYPEAAPCPDLS